MRSLFIFLVLLTPVLFFGCSSDSRTSGVPAGPVSLVSLEVTPSGPSMAPDTGLQLQAIGTFSDSTRKEISTSVDWLSANAAIASVSSTGMVTAPPASLGAAVITAASGSISVSTVVTVSPLASLKVTPGSPNLAPGTGQQVTATGVLRNSAQQDLTAFTTWTSSDTGIATVQAPGLITAGSLAAGKSTISATFSAVTCSFLLTVSPVASITVTPSEAVIAPGKAQQFTAFALLMNNERQNITEFVTWDSLSPHVVLMKGSGLGVAVSPGSAVVIATLGSASGSALAAVNEGTPVSAAIVPEAAVVELGTGLQIDVFVTFSDGSVRNLTHESLWSSSDQQVAVVSNAVGSKGLVTPLTAGTATIRAICRGIASPVVTLTIIQSPAFSPIAISPAGPALRPGTSMQFTALLLSGAGPAPADITAEAVWSSSDETVVFVAQGLATALRPGFAVITARFGTFSASTLLTVPFF